MNKELLERTMQYIEDHPEEHDQTMWFVQTPCGTTACFAGWACVLSGLKPDFTIQAPFNYRPDITYHVEGTDEWVKPVAQKLLGLTHYDADTLFDASNTVEELKMYVKDLLNGEHPARERTW
jgi:hypothetical protein